MMCEAEAVPPEATLVFEIWGSLVRQTYFSQWFTDGKRIYSKLQAKYFLGWVSVAGCASNDDGDILESWIKLNFTIAFDFIA
jgi:hypothetical protein